jgi:ribosome-binding protein aMBF1 (putative translation factor)
MEMGTDAPLDKSQYLATNYNPYASRHKLDPFHWECEMALDPRRRIGRRIRQAREQKNLTQRALAKQLGCCYQLVQQYERGEKLSLDRICAIANMLDVEPVQLLNGL